MKKLLIIFSFVFYVIFSHAQEAARLLSEYIQIPSVSGDEAKAAKYLEKICSEKGLNIHVFSSSDSSYNFSASIFPLTDNKPNIVFLNHIDVVPVDDKKDWRYPPFSGKIVNDTLWGRGTLDMKGI
ncbi:MAG: M20/M25/M40 family metallo-hydrolase, partial [Bacteroidia bacterium]